MHPCVALLPTLPSSLLKHAKYSGEKKHSRKLNDKSNEVCHVGRDTPIPVGSDAQRTSSSSPLRRFVGAAIIPHILPFLSLNRMIESGFSRNERQLRILLAGGIKVELFVQLFHGLQQLFTPVRHQRANDDEFVSVEIFVWHEDETVLAALRHTLQTCQLLHLLEPLSSFCSVNVVFVSNLADLYDATHGTQTMDIIDFNADARFFVDRFAHNSANQNLEKDTEKERFYDLELQISRLYGILTPKHGKLFFSFLNENRFTSVYQELLTRRNVSHFAPFSTDIARLYLHATQRDTDHLLVSSRFRNTIESFQVNHYSTNSNKRDTAGVATLLPATYATHRDTKMWMRDTDVLLSMVSQVNHNTTQIDHLLKLTRDTSVFGSFGFSNEDNSNDATDAVSGVSFSDIVSLVYKTRDTLDFPGNVIGQDTVRTNEEEDERSYTNHYYDYKSHVTHPSHHGVTATHKRQRRFTFEEMVSMTRVAGFRVTACLPLSLCHPYGMNCTTNLTILKRTNILF